MNSIKRIVTDLKAFAIQYLRNPFGLLFAIGFPMLMLLTMGGIFGSKENSDINLLIQSFDQTDTSQEFVDILKEKAEDYDGVFVTHPSERDYEMSEDIVNEFKLTGSLVFAEDFAESGEVLFYADTGQSQYGFIQEVLDEAVSEFSGVDSVEFEVVNIDIPEEFIFINFLLPGVIAIGIMINCLMILASLMADYWAKGYFKILKTTPLRKWEWIASKVIWYLFIMAVSIALMLVIGVLVFEADVQVTLLSVLIMAVGTILFIAMGILIGAFVKNSDVAAGVSNGVGQPMLWLSGTFWPLEEMPKVVQYIAKVIPLTYLTDGLRQSMVEMDQGEALKNLLILIGFTVVFVVAASNLISWKEK